MPWYLAKRIRSQQMEKNAASPVRPSTPRPRESGGCTAGERRRGGEVRRERWWKAGGRQGVQVGRGGGVPSDEDLSAIEMPDAGFAQHANVQRDIHRTSQRGGIPQDHVHQGDATIPAQVGLEESR